MADSTAFIDTTSTFDATSYVYVDDSTSDVTAAADAQAGSLVQDFSAASGPVEKQSKEAEKGFNDIIDLMSSIDPTDYTPEAMMDSFTQNALDQAYATTSWQQGVDGLKQANVVSANCSLFDSGSTPKYGDLARQISSMKAGVLANVNDAISNVADDIQSKAGKAIAELEIGRKLSDLVNTGSSATDEAKKSNSSPVSSILETGKAGMAKAQSLMSKLAGPMQALDKVLECTNAIGGSKYTGDVDDMIDTTQGLYQKMYMFDDPASPQYGEFNQGAFANSIPSVPKKVLDNTFKVANMFNKSQNNATLTTDRLVKQAKEGAKSTSSLAPNNENQTNDDKRNIADRMSEFKVTFPKVPAAPGRSAQSSGSSTTPEPEPAPIPTDPRPKAQPEEEISYRNLIVETKFVSDGSYQSMDPQESGVPSILSTATDMIPDGGTTDTNAQMKITVIAANIRYTKQDAGGGQVYNQVRIAPISVEFERVDKVQAYPIAFQNFTGKFNAVDEADWKVWTADQQRKAVIKVTNIALKNMIGKDTDTIGISAEDFEKAFG